jgi:hypothetical protein
MVKGIYPWRSDLIQIEGQLQITAILARHLGSPTPFTHVLSPSLMHLAHFGSSFDGLLP